jgi:hypothetical protein
MRIVDCQVEFYFPFENNGREQGRRHLRKRLMTFVLNGSNPHFLNKPIYLKLLIREGRNGIPCVESFPHGKASSMISRLNFR